MLKLLFDGITSLYSAFYNTKGWIRIKFSKETLSKCAHLHYNFFNERGETKMFCVGIFVVHGFDPWQCGEFLHIVPQKNLAPYMQWVDTGNWSCTPHPFSIPHTKPHNSSPTSVGLQHVIQYTCSHSPCCRMCNVSELESGPLTFPSDVCGHRKQAGKTDIVQHGSPSCSSQPHLYIVYILQKYTIIYMVRYITVIFPHTAHKPTQTMVRPIATKRL